MNATDWNNIARCAIDRKDQFGDTIRWTDYDRYQREYDTMIAALAMAARLRRTVV